MFDWSKYGISRYYYADDSGIIVGEDCEAGMKVIPDNSIDLVATDPPYGLSFMGKDWDKAVPSVAKWRECLRVLKPGAFAFIMCTPRQDCLARMIVNLQDAGFRTDFTPIYWAYASGFPKAENISKMVDKQLGVEREVIGQKVRGDVEKAKQNGSTFAVADANKNNKAIFGYGVENITKPSSPQAKALDGSYGGFQPKPAVEVILVVMKPLSCKTFVAQALENSKGITWLDDCRIPFVTNESAYENGVKRAEKPRNDIRGGNFHVGEHDNHIVNSGMSQSGRFPANLLVCDDVLNDGENKRSSGLYNCSHKTNIIFNNVTSWSEDKIQYNDSGSFSRYFSLDAWWNEKVKTLPENVQDVFPFLICPKASKGEKNIGCEELDKKIQYEADEAHGNLGHYIVKMHGGENGDSEKSKNNHPTVKPLKLMSYLVTLGSRPNEVVLDPFIGSGTTARACKILNRKCIGFEIDTNQYIDIAKHRQDKVQISLI